MNNTDKKNAFEIESLVLDDLDIETLDGRLEMALFPMGLPDDLPCSPYTCVGLCTLYCTIH